MGNATAVASGVALLGPLDTHTISMVFLLENWLRL
jgi:hypothetical protein